VIAEVPFANLQQSFRGMRLNDYPFDASKIELIGILLGDKKPGEFRIEIDWIAAYREAKSEPLLSKCDDRKDAKAVTDDDQTFSRQTSRVLDSDSP